jgi:hypothetical protein
MGRPRHDDPRELNFVEDYRDLPCLTDEEVCVTAWWEELAWVLDATVPVASDEEPS